MKKRIIKIIAIVLIFCFSIFPINSFAVYNNIEIHELNGDGYVSVLECLMVLRVMSGHITFTPEQTALADVNHDGKLKISDAL